ncbi:hypothetical protein Nepgr_009111 [Nepenthes gracilis]|uniref:FAS1 domain-containing protein n=1 Tax=Nepenthes gracilis TaxID=150966 RepID=A0AAD3SAD7_NEPGR|nr:hypothetical protein Nepgr_009111 [Nepenthes gracilis]
MASLSLSAILLAITSPLLLFFSHCQAAQSSTAPGPSSTPVNLTGILDKGGQFTEFIRLLATTQAEDQIENQINTSTEGMTVFAPTDNAFNNLKSGALNGLSDQEQVQLVLYHILPKFYSLASLQTVSNPVRTQATGQDGVWGLNFTSQGTQVNVSTGVVETQLNNALRQEFPLAVYEVDKVLLPEELYGTKAPAPAAPSPKRSTSNSSSSTTTKSHSEGPSASEQSNGGGKVTSVLWGGGVGLALICVGFLS